MSETWLQYWRDTPDDEYLTVEAGVVAKNIIEHFAINQETSVLDFGCGYGHVAARLAEHAGHVYLWDAVPAVLDSAAERIGASHVTKADLDRHEGFPTVDLIVVNSVIQYMGEETLGEWLQSWSGMLTRRGALLLSDVPTEVPSLVRESWEWFKLTARAGKLPSAIRFSVQNASRYADARQEEPLNVHTRADIERLAGKAGLGLMELERNLAFQRSRSSFVLERKTG